MKLVLALFTLSFFPQIGFSQDLIIRHDSVRIEAKVTEISDIEIRYKQSDNPDGPTFVLRQSEVYKVKYSNGQELVFQKPVAGSLKPEKPTNPQVAAFPPGQLTSAQPAKEETYTPTAAEMHNRGTLDAKNLYRGGNALWWTLGATILFPPAGLVVGTAVGASPPRKSRIRVPDENLLYDDHYKAGYRKEAQKRKLGNAAAGFFLGIGALGMYVFASGQSL